MRGIGGTSGQLFVLDADCGQPTFNLPGTISLLKETKANKGVHATFKAVQKTFLNSPNPAADADAYLGTILEQIEVFSRVSGSKKLIINTCGWVEGFGAEIFLQMVHAI